MASINKREQNIEYRVYRLQTRKTDFRHFRSLLRGIQTHAHKERQADKQTDRRADTNFVHVFGKRPVQSMA